MNQKIGIVGLGLIGASLAKAIKQNTEGTGYGLDIDGETMKSALADHSIDGELNDFGQLDLLIVALFPKVTVEFILEHIDQMKPGSIIMDICGVKKSVVSQVAQVCKSHHVEFIGGHPMAAGLSMEEKNVELFRRRLNDNCTLTEQDLIPKIMIDVPMPISYLSKKLTEQLKVLEPFGKGNSKPLFAQKNLRAVGIRVLGRNRNVAKMLLIDENGIKMDAVYFGEAQ